MVASCINDEFAFDSMMANIEDIPPTSANNIVMGGNLDAPSSSSAVNNNSIVGGIVGTDSNGNILENISDGFGTYNPICHHTHVPSTSSLGRLANNVIKLSTFNDLYNKSARGHEEGGPIANHQIYLDSAKFTENGVICIPNLNLIMAPTKRRIAKVFFNKTNRVLLMPVVDLSESNNTFYMSQLATHETFECIYVKISSNDHSKTELSFDDGTQISIVYSGSSVTLEKIGRDGKRSYFRFCFNNPHQFVQEIAQVHSVIQFYCNIQDLRQMLSNYCTREFSNCSCYRSGNFKLAHNCIISYYYNLEVHPLPHINYVFGDVLGVIREFAW